MTMDFEPIPQDDPRRVELRAWISNNPNPTGRQLADARLVAPHWPAPWGLDADPIHQLIIDEELRGAGISRPRNAIGIGWAGPTILGACSTKQQERYLPKILSGEEQWCQLFSEPDAGSDLAALATRAVRDGDEYVVNGSKIWSSHGHLSDFGILIARTDPDVAKHKGLSYFICPMDTPGLTMQPIVDMTTAHSFNQVFFEDVRIPVSLRVGAEGDGWRLAKVTLANERVQLSSAGSMWGSGPSTAELFELLRGTDALTDPVVRQEAASVWAESEVLRLTRLRTLSAQLAGGTPGPEASIQKLLADHHGQRVMALAKRVAGTRGMLNGSGPAGDLAPRALGGPTEVRYRKGDQDHSPNTEGIWHYGFLFAPALTLGGGTFAIQRNIIAEHVLGLPRDMHGDKGMTWSEFRRSPR